MKLIHLFPLTLLGCAHAPLNSQCDGAASLDVVAADGGLSHLHHHPAAGPPVLVVHGLSSNSRCWDLSPERSLAVALNAAGYDAWLLDLRGHGYARDAAKAQPGHAPPRWTVDDYGRYDLDAAIRAIQAATGYQKVGYVGHSMGGMVAAVYQAWHGDDALAALVIVGSPLDFRHPEPVLKLGERSFPMATASNRVPSPAGAKGLAVFGAKAPWHADDVLASADNLSRLARREMYHNVVSPMYREELRQLTEMVQTGRFRSADGRIDYADALAGLRAPALVIAGRGDLIAPADRVWAWYAAAGSTDKAWVVAGLADGFSADYGHLDLTLGDHARDEIYPRITGWFAGRWAEEASPGATGQSARYSH